MDLKPNFDDLDLAEQTAFLNEQLNAMRNGLPAPAFPDRHTRDKKIIGHLAEKHEFDEVVTEEPATSVSTYYPETNEIRGTKRSHSVMAAAGSVPYRPYPLKGCSAR